MPQLIEITGYGHVSFPDEMTQEQIVSAIESDILPSIQSQSSNQQRVAPPNLPTQREDQLIDQPGLADDFTNFGRSLQRGGWRARQTFFGTGVANTIALPSQIEQAQQELASFDALVASNPQLQQGPNTISQRSRLAGRVAQLEGELQLRNRSLPSSLTQTQQAQRRLAEIPLAGAMREFHEGDWVKALKENPVEVIAGLTAESLPQMAPALVAGVVGGIPGAVGVGLSSLGVESSNTIIDSLKEQGVDVGNPETFKELTPEKLEIARTRAIQRGVPIGMFDAATAGLAGKILRPALGKGAARVGLGVAGETAMQAGGGAAGEASAQLVSEGEVSDWRSVAAEAAAELSSTPGDVFGGLRANRRASEAAARIVRPEEPPSVDEDVEFISRAAAEVEDTNQHDLSGFGSAAREATPEQTSVPVDPVQQAAANALGQDQTELRQQEAIINGEPVVVAEEEVIPPVVVPEGITELEPDSYQRIADEPVAEGNRAFQDAETFDVFQVPENATAEQIEAARQQARQEAADLEFQFLQEERRQSEEQARKEADELRKIIGKKDAPETRNIWDNPENLKRQLDQQEQNLKRAQAGTLKDPSGNAVTPQQLEPGVQALRDRYTELTGKQAAAKEATKGMRRGNRAEQGSTAIPQAVMEFAQSIYRQGVEFRDWSKQMLRSLGGNIRPYLQQIWDGLTRAVNALSPSQRSRVQTRMQRRDFSEGGEFMGAGGSQQQPQPTEQPAPTAQPQRRQVYGRREGETYEPVKIREIQDRVRKEIFDGTKPITKAQTTRAKNLAYAWASDGRAIAAEMGKTDPSAPTVVKTELFRYATNLAAQGDPSLQQFLLENDSQMAEGTPGVIGSASDAGLIMRLRRLMDHPAWKPIQEVSDQAKQIVDRVVGADPALDALKTRLAELGLDPQQVLDALNNINDKGGQNIQDLLGKLVGSEGAKKTRNKRSQPEKTPEDQQKDNESDAAQKEADAAQSEVDKLAKQTAASILNRFEQSQTEWLKPDAQINEVREIINGELKGQHPLPDEYAKWDQYINPLADRLRNAGVSDELATRLAQETYNQLVANRATKTWKAAEAAKKRAEKLAEQKAKRDAARAAKAANAPTDTAISILDGFERSQTEWVKPEASKNAIRELINNELRGQSPLPDPNNSWGYIRGLADRLVGLGVRRKEALDLAQATYEQLLNRRSATRQKAMQDAFDNGNVRPIINAILETPMADRTGDWVKRTTLQFFEDAGLPPDLAQAASRVFTREINAKFEQAADQALNEFVKQSTPWSNRINSPNKAERTKAERELDKLRKAARLQATDPSKTFTAEVAKQNGWKGFSAADHKRMAEIDHRLSEPDILPTEEIKLRNEMMNIARKAKLPTTAMDAIADSYNASALSSLGTIGVNLYGPVGEVIGQYMSFNAGAFLPNGGGFDQVIYNTEQLIQAVANMPRNMRYSATNDVYMLTEHETMLQGKALLNLLEKAKEDWNSGNAVRMANAVPKVAFGAMDFVRRAFNILDDANFRAMEQYYRALYGSQAMRQKGYNSEQIRAMAAASQSVYQHGYQTGIDMGMSPSEAGMRGRDMVKEAYIRELGSNVGTQEALDVARAAEQDALLALGRNDGRLEEGMVSSLVMNPLNDFITKMRSGNPLQRIIATMLFGFVRTPFQLARYGASYTPYGAFRYAIHQSRTKRGLPSFWEQSMGTQQQARQRLIQSVGGTLAMGMLIPLMTGSSDEDRRNGIKVVITGNGPGYEDKAYRDSWLKEHKQNSIEFYAGGKRRLAIPYARGALEGLSWVFAMAGAVDDYSINHGKKEALGKEDQLNAAAEIAGRYAASAMQRGAMMGGRNTTSDFLRNPSSGSTRLVGQVGHLAAPLIPAAGLTRSIENILMSPRDRSSASAAIIASIPVTAPFGEPELNFLGDPVRDVTMQGRALTSGLPVLAQTAQVDPIYQLIGGKMVAPNTLVRSEVERALNTRLTNKEWNQVTSLYGLTLKDKMYQNYERLYGMESAEAKLLMDRLSTESKRATLRQFQ